MTRRALARFMRNLEPCLVGLEACGGAHHWARMLRAMGHDARLMSPQFVRPYVKSIEQQDVQQVHRVRSQAVAHRTALANQVRGFLLEYEIAVAKGIGHLRRRLPEVLEDADNGLSGSMRELLAELGDELHRLDERVGRFDVKIREISRETPACRRLERIPGVGSIVSTALVAAVGDGSEFGNGRELAAWVGVVPRQRSTGGRNVLLGISKRGDQYLRSLVHPRRAGGATNRIAARGPPQSMGG